MKRTIYMAFSMMLSALLFAACSGSNNEPLFEESNQETRVDNSLPFYYQDGTKTYCNVSNDWAFIKYRTEDQRKVLQQVREMGGKEMLHPAWDFDYYNPEKQMVDSKEYSTTMVSISVAEALKIEGIAYAGPCAKNETPGENFWKYIPIADRINVEFKYGDKETDEKIVNFAKENHINISPIKEIKSESYTEWMRTIFLTRDTKYNAVEIAKTLWEFGGLYQAEPIIDLWGGATHTSDAASSFSLFPLWAIEEGLVNTQDVPQYIIDQRWAEIAAEKEVAAETEGK